MKGTSVSLTSPSWPGRDHDRAIRLTALAVPLVIASAVLTGCASSASSPASAPPASASAETAAYPVTITNCGTSVTYTQAPQRAVSNDINTTEDMLALGLESHMVGTFGVTGDGPVGQPVPTQYFTKEELVGLHPDFLFAGWNYGLQTGTSLTPQGLAQFGIKTLALTESCIHVQKGVTTVSIADTYQDLRNLGEIFNIRAKAQQVITAMQAQVAAAQAKIAGLKPVTVFDYDSGEAAPFTGAGLATPAALISLGGGTNIFASLKQSFASVSWEQVVKADPQCIIINDYGTPTAAQKEKFLETSPITRNLTAVKNRCFLPLSYDPVTPGPRNSQAVVAIARWLHPAAFGLPADGDGR
jgi:iron complex transport system substrate-binding protein